MLVSFFIEASSTMQFWYCRLYSNFFFYIFKGYTFKADPIGS